MRQDDKAMFEDAVKAMRSDVPEAAELSASASRLASRLGMDASGGLSAAAQMEAIGGCDDVQRLLGAYRAGGLTTTRSLLIAAHLRECGACLRQSHGVDGAQTVDWSAPDWAAPGASKPGSYSPAAARSVWWTPRVFGWATVPACALLACSVLGYKAYWQVPPGVRAEVRSIDGTAYRISDAGDRPLAPGDTLAEGEHLRTSGGGHAVLGLPDGSTVEVNERSVLALGARGHDVTLSLDDGAVIVEAAKRVSGHMYVKTPDCRVAVTGTIFSVNSGIKGSRVAVLEGAVHVTHGGIDTTVGAGDQLATNENQSAAPVAEQVAWSHDQAKLLPLLAQFAVLEHRVAQIPFPQPRYKSDLLGRVPADTVLYVSIPNLGEFLSQANSIFQEQMKQSPELEQWWGSGKNRNAAELDAFVGRLHEMSQYLGDEVVVTGMTQGSGPGFAVLADLERGGLDEYLRTHFPAAGGSPGIVVLDEATLAAADVTARAQGGQYALMRRHEVVFSNSVAMLKKLNAQLDAGASGFAEGDFGKQITAAYGRGAGVILAADVHRMMRAQFTLRAGNGGNKTPGAETGMEDLSYLIAEHREMNGQPENHLNVQFAGTRRGVASWLAAPAPIGSLDFVSPNAAVAVAFLSKDPKAIADDLMTMAATDNDKDESLDKAEQELHINFRDDLAANLGGDFLLSLDGPVFPTPAWKALIEVHNAQQLEGTMERLAQASQAARRPDAAKQGHGVTIQSSETNGQRFYAMVAVGSGATVAEYTFADGYMIVTPNRALLMEALRTHASGNSLAHSAAFKALLPKDENDNYSAVAYQNLSPVLTPLLSQLTGPSAVALQELAVDARPTAICAWGKDSRIEAASNSRLMGFDFLTLATLMHHGNKHGEASVQE